MVKVKKDQDGVNGCCGCVWAAITSGELYQNSNLPLLRLFLKSNGWRQGFTKLIKKMMAGCNKILDRTSTGTVFLCSNYLIMDAY